MIYEKSFKLPELKRRTIKRELSLFSEKDGALYCRGIHFKKGKKGLVMAEGAELVSALPDGCAKLLSSSGHADRVFAYLEEDRLLSLDDEKKYLMTQPPKSVVLYRTKDGDELLFV